MATRGAQVEEEMNLRSSLFPSWKELNSEKKAQRQSGKVSSDFQHAPIHTAHYKPFVSFSSRHHMPEREASCHLLLIHRMCCLISPFISLNNSEMLTCYLLDSELLRWT